jgi:sugar (pentulose or hexulose) kinase
VVLRRRGRDAHSRRARPDADPPVPARLTAGWLGLDLGTTGARAVVVDDDGAVLGRGEQPLAGDRDGPRHEQDPRAWWSAAAAACRAALAGITDIHGVAVCATSGTVALVDADGEPVSPGLMYDDTRATAEADRLGRPVSFGLPKLHWLLDHHPGPGRLAHQADIVTARLAGRPVAADSSHALKSGYDLEREQWAVDDLPAGTLPDVVRPGTRLAEVCADAAQATGLPQGTPIVAGMTDACAAQIATGRLAVGDWSSTLGTTLALKGVATAPVRDPAGVVYAHRAPDGEWLPGGASSCGAGALAVAFPERDLAALTRAAAAYESTPVLAYPLVGRGERFPFSASAAEPFVLGRPSSDAELFAALLHGLASVERLCFDALDLRGLPTGGAVTLGGGASTGNDYLCQLRADVLGRRVRLVEHGDSAFGMAVLAAAGGRPLADVAERMARERAAFDPRPDRAAELAGRFLELVGELRRRGWIDVALAAHATNRAAAYQQQRC